ncbi:MAG: class I SAM-dependent methyltransferase [Bacteroidota bacterium]|nr:class I SAM-dependent methyltransferase [Bacteroidota bacterium]
MNSLFNHTNEQQAALAFTGQSVIFDRLYEEKGIMSYKRTRVRQHLLKYINSGSKILELNAGTGDDAIFLAQHGHYIHATDISAGMQERLKEKLSFYQLNDFVTTELCSYTSLKTISNRGPYDCIFSNFAGLNCTGNLDLVLAEFDSLLKPDGIAVLTMLPRFCLWETLLIFRGKFKTATRRFFSSKGRKANIEGVSFTCWYYSPRYVMSRMKRKFSLIEIEGLCTIVPPSYIGQFSEKYPRVYSFLCKTEDRVKSIWPWKFIGDYFIISLKKK